MSVWTIRMGMHHQYTRRLSLGEKKNNIHELVIFRSLTTSFPIKGTFQRKVRVGKQYIKGSCDVLSMFVMSKWQSVVLLTRWRASVRALFYWYHTFLDHTTNISIKVCAPRCISASGAPNNFQNCHLDKTNMDKTSQQLLNIALPVGISSLGKKKFHKRHDEKLTKSLLRHIIKI